MGPKRWQDWINTILGIWMLISPWVLGFAVGANAAAITAWVLGAAIVIFAVSAIYIPKAWEEALNIIFGVLLIISPWGLRYADMTGATTNAVVVGVLVTALAIWAMIIDTNLRKLREQRHQPR